jgi:hypothetical protein
MLSRARVCRRMLVTRLKDANVQDPSKAVVRAVEFHKHGQVLFTAGMDKTIRLFQVSRACWRHRHDPPPHRRHCAQIDGVRNPKLQGVGLPDMPIRCAHFSADGARRGAVSARIRTTSELTHVIRLGDPRVGPPALLLHLRRCARRCA